MTRSVEVPDNIDEVLDVAHAAAVARWITGSSDTTQMLLSVDAALEAALPYLAPAVPQPAPIDLVHELRDALGLPNSALPITPKAAWEDALKHARGLAAGWCGECEKRAARSAVPQPVDREALVKALTKHSIMWTRTDSTVACACDPAVEDKRLPIQWRTYAEFSAHQTAAVLALPDGLQ